ncbi:MAG: Glycosyltransferase AglJ [Methanomethylovorans sp. PtaU1.Bin093]|uniref:S-layer glycoprotein N-glycosyltransferase AglJ n=1 Tax=Methanomethylovorans sp. PtaU1.Bin093 TaxID=1811679 RepID=UPI0009CB0A07|nr:S-layer glycoprotein N-glycosyltransferase AglJ [Methanomethylovorans sp. PtaU1.Bin093]OPY21396.1 MAG: Glycosyltransferase AglJ [Methanomethylovorans sp. PtaU1.Bin093]
MQEKDVCILIPTLNEGATIAQLIRDFRSEGFNDIIVIDGHSTDKTRELAEAEGARVVLQKGKGKGQAVQEAFETLDNEYLVMLDGDGTYLASDAHAMLAPLLDGRAEHVIGNRLNNFEKGAFPGLNLIGNKLINRLFSMAYRQNLTDILTGYRAFTRGVYKSFALKETGFEVESEMTIQSIKLEHAIEVVPITYLSRKSDAATKLNPLKDGFRIGKTIYLLARFHNPMFYFGMIGTIFILSGLVTGTYVVDQWFKGITRIPMTVLTALLIMSGFQMFVLGMLSDLMVSMHMEIMRVLRQKDKSGKQ